MSFTEILEGVKLLTVEEKQQLRDVLAEDCESPACDAPTYGLRPGERAYFTPEMRVDESILRRFFESSGVKDRE